jgi:hypothetical protein
MNPRSVDRRLDMQIPGRMKETAVCAVSNQTNPATDGEINAAVSDQVSPVTDRCRGSQRYTSAQPHGEGAQAFPINPMKELSEEIAHMIYYEIERHVFVTPIHRPLSSATVQISSYHRPTFFSLDEYPRKASGPASHHLCCLELQVLARVHANN